MNAEMPHVAEPDQPLAETIEYPPVQTALNNPGIQEDTMQPSGPEHAPAQELDPGSRNAFEAVKDMYYKAGAKYSVLTTMGEASNSPVLVNVNALKRRKMVERGMAMLACAKLGMDMYKAAKGFHTTIQSEFFQDLAQVEIPVEASDQMKQKDSRMNASDVLDHTLEYSHQGMEGATNALISSPPDRRKSAKHKAAKQH